MDDWKEGRKGRRNEGRREGWKDGRKDGRTAELKGWMHALQLDQIRENLLFETTDVLKTLQYLVCLCPSLCMPSVIFPEGCLSEYSFGRS